MNEYFCVLPFYSVEIKHNKTENIYCCRLPKKTNIDDVRQSILTRQRSSSCSTCWKLEDQGLNSERQLHNSAFDFYLDRDLEKIEQDAVDGLYSSQIIKLSTSNLCNGTCVTCGSADSSAWASLENKKINYNKISQSEIEKINWKDIKQLSFIGGEPLLEKLNFEILTQLIQLKNTECFISIVTNGSCELTSTQFEILSKFKNVSICLSIDGIGPVFEYMRFPLKWNVLLENIEKFKTISKHLSVSYTLSNVNIMYYQETVDWFNSQDLQFYHNLVTFPAYYNINSLPEFVKSEPAIAQFFREHKPSDDVLFQKAIADLERQDNLKNINCRNFVPKFTDLF
jgi:MoaA/NifB/PqqE/SkfB family radical SAM enzyme